MGIRAHRARRIVSALIGLGLIAVLLAACGGGGPKRSETQTGYIVLTITRPPLSEVLPQGGQSVAPQAIEEEATHLRLLLYRQGYEVLHDVQLPEPGDTVTTEIEVLVGSGYTIDAIAYQLAGDESVVMNAARATDIVVEYNQTTEVPMTLSRYTYTFTEQPDPVASGETYTLSAAIANGPNVFDESGAQVKVATSTWADDATAWSLGTHDAVVTESSGSALTAQYSATAPSVQANTLHYYGFRVKVASAYYDADEGMPAMWLYAPTVNLGDSPGSFTVKPRTGGISIILQ